MNVDPIEEAWKSCMETHMYEKTQERSEKARVGREGSRWKDVAAGARE